MPDNKIVQRVEIDFDYCTRTFGVGTCNAAFGPAIVRKCYNTFTTCPVQAVYNKATNTLKFIEASYSVKSGNHIPALVKVGGYEQEVNIAGFSNKIGSLGVRALVEVTIRDFPSRDTLTDKYFSQRMDGTAQTNEAGYDPIDRGSFWTKFKARVPNYAGRALRVIQCHYDDAGNLVDDSIRHYVMDEIVGPDKSGNVIIKAKDILSLVDDDKALAPRSNQGRLLSDMTDSDGSFTLSPSGIGNAEYPSSGFITVGSEIMGFTRSGNTMTVNRGRYGTVASTHTANDTVQVAFRANLERADSVIYRLLTEYGNIPASYITLSEWTAEFDRWGASMYLSALICKPNGVSKLIGEINQLGITLWWDETAQKIRVKLNHPPDTAPVEWSDRNNIISITTEDNDDDRATRVEMWTVQIDPTKELSKDNFLRNYKTIGVAEESPDMFGSSRVQIIYNRWLNQGADSTTKIITGRLLNRYKRAPVTYTVKLDVKDDPDLTDVISLNSYVETDITGLVTPKLTQVYYRADDRNGSTVTAKLQSYQFNARYGLIANNARPLYNDSTAAQKLKGSYFVGPTLLFDDATPAYQFA